MSAQAPRVLSGLFCSTSRPGEGPALRCDAARPSGKRGAASRQEPRPAPQGPGGWLGAGCNLQRRPHMPQLPSKVGEGVAVVQGLQPSTNGSSVRSEGDSFISTQFVAESLIPTASGKYRVRAYRHSVRELAAWCKDAVVPVVPVPVFVTGVSASRSLGAELNLSVWPPVAQTHGCVSLAVRSTCVLVQRRGGKDFCERCCCRAVRWRQDVLGADLHYDGEAGGRRGGVAPMGLCLRVVQLRVWSVLSVLSLLVPLKRPRPRASQVPVRVHDACFTSGRRWHASCLVTHRVLVAFVGRRFIWEGTFGWYVVLRISVGVPGS